MCALRAGLGSKLGVLLFQLSPLPMGRLIRMQQTLSELEQLALAVQAHLAGLPEDARPIVAYEVRDPDWLRPDVAPQFARILRTSGATYCLGLHAKMPRIAEQLPMLRARPVARPAGVPLECEPGLRPLWLCRGRAETGAV